MHRSVETETRIFRSRASAAVKRIFISRRTAAALGQRRVQLQTAPQNSTLPWQGSALCYRVLCSPCLAVLHRGRLHHSPGGRVPQAAAQPPRGLHRARVHRVLRDRAVQHHSGTAGPGTSICPASPSPSPARDHSSVRDQRCPRFWQLECRAPVVPGCKHAQLRTLTGQKVAAGDGCWHCRCFEGDG